MMMTHVEEGTLTLRGNEIPVKIGLAAHQDLMFFPDNPRVYTIVGAAASEATQEQIFSALSKMDHVKQLVQSIKANGGLHEPIIVRNRMVLEGNSRLAAYRLLSQGDPITWGRIKCKVLPDNVGDDIIFALLGEYHIIGKKDWAPFEQAGYLYRRHMVHSVPTNIIAKELSVTTNLVNKLIRTYEFMMEHKEDNVDRWSYYEEYLKIRKVNEVRGKYPKLDTVFAQKVKSGDICRAADVRDKLKVVLHAKPKTVEKFIEGEKSFEESYHAAVDQGHSDASYKRLHAFRNWIVDIDAEEDLLNLTPEVRTKCLYELNKIHKRVEKLVERLV